MQKLTIIGNLTNDPELRTTTSGKNVCTFTVAVNRPKRNGEDQGADFFRVSAWGERGEVCAKYLSKGKKVAVVGTVSVHAYSTKKGDPAASMEVFAEDVEFLTPRSETPGNTVKTSEEKKDEQSGFAIAEADDLPF